MTVQPNAFSEAVLSPCDGSPAYMTGFENSFATEAVLNALPLARNSPQKAPLGLYAEQISGTAFTQPRHVNRRTPSGTGTEQQGNQLGIGEPLRPAFQQLLTRALSYRPGTDAALLARLVFDSAALEPEVGRDRRPLCFRHGHDGARVVIHLQGHCLSRAIS